MSLSSVILRRSRKPSTGKAPGNDPDVGQTHLVDELGEVADGRIAQVVVALDDVALAVPAPPLDLLVEYLVLGREDKLAVLAQDVPCRRGCLLLHVEVDVTTGDAVLLPKLFVEVVAATADVCGNLGEVIQVHAAVHEDLAEDDVDAGLLDLISVKQDVVDLGAELRLPHFDTRGNRPPVDADRDGTTRKIKL